MARRCDCCGLFGLTTCRAVTFDGVVRLCPRCAGWKPKEVSAEEKEFWAFVRYRLMELRKQQASIEAHLFKSGSPMDDELKCEICGRTEGDTWVCEECGRRFCECSWGHCGDNDGVPVCHCKECWDKHLKKVLGPLRLTADHVHLIKVLRGYHKKGKEFFSREVASRLGEDAVPVLEEFLAAAEMPWKEVTIVDGKDDLLERCPSMEEAERGKKEIEEFRKSVAERYALKVGQTYKLSECLEVM